MLGFPKAHDTSINTWHGDLRTQDAFPGLRAEITFTEADRGAGDLGGLASGVRPLTPAQAWLGVRWAPKTATRLQLSP